MDRKFSINFDLKFLLISIHKTKFYFILNELRLSDLIIIQTKTQIPKKLESITSLTYLPILNEFKWA